MGNKNIRLAQPENVIALRDVVSKAYARYQDVIDDLPDVSSGLADDVRDHDVWVVEQAGAVVGCVVLIHNDDIALVANLAVDPRCAGSGLGRALMAKAELRARATGHNAMRLNTHQKMPANVAFYERQGWKVVEMSPPKVIMSKNLMTDNSDWV